MTDLYTYEPNEYPHDDSADWVIIKNEQGEQPDVVACACTEALAKQICALPDLLDALKGLCDQLHKGRKFDVRKDYDLLLADSAARKAIAKAEGTESP